MPQRTHSRSTRKRGRLASPDLSATIEQSAVDKLLNSVNYPFTIMEQSWPPQGRVLSGTSVDSLYSQAVVKKILQDASALKPNNDLDAPVDDPHEQLLGDVLAGASAVIESAKSCLNAHDSATPQQPYSGPDPRDLQKILKGGVKNLADTAKGIQFAAHLDWLKIVLRDKPSASLNVPTTSLSNIDIAASATVEIWWYHPTLHCSWLCFNWSTTWSWDRLTTLTLNDIKLTGVAHANVSASGTLITIKGIIDKLRFDYPDFPILDDIPLEDIVNPFLDDKLIVFFDAGKYLATVPVLNSRFSISSVQLPPTNGRIEVDIAIKQI